MLRDSRVRQVMCDFFDLRAIPRATRYAVATMFQGMALGLFLGIMMTWMLGLAELPTWPLLIVALAIYIPGVVITIRAYRELKRELLRNCCPNCEYDLRGTTHEGAKVCPECGTAIDADR